MSLHPFHNRLALVFFSVSLMISCIKTSSLVNVPTVPPINADTVPPAITSVGTPVGNPVSQTIGPSGGSITSSDGAVQLTIPAGALTTNTTITIQPVTNECPGGMGFGYDFLPNGTQFAKPATLSFNYWQQDSLNDPNLFFIAYQASDGSWAADISGVDIDTVAKTVNLGISHFTPYQMFSGIYIYNPQPNSEYNKGEYSNLELRETFDPGSPGFNMNNATIQLIEEPLPSSAVGDWDLWFKEAYDGKLVSLGRTAIFYAPDHIDPSFLKNWVGNFLHINLIIPGKNGKTKTIKNPLISRTVGFIPKYSYDIRIDMEGSGLSQYYSDTYTDSATFHVDVDPVWRNSSGEDGRPRSLGAYHVSLSNEKNYSPNDQPAHFETGTYDIDWLPDSYGLINITGAQIAAADQWTSKTISIFFNQPGTETPGWNIIDKSSGANVGWPPALQPGVPAGIVFSFWDSSQYQPHRENPKLPYNVTITSN